MSDGSTVNFSWKEIQLVVFDVDGTLYRQRPLRIRIGLELALSAVRRRSTRDIRILRVYRRLREDFGSTQVDNFEPQVLQSTAHAMGLSLSIIQEVAATWIDSKPLRHLPACRFAGIQELFTALRQNGKLVGVFSDYPAKQKLEALALQADLVVSATDHDVGILKPHPRGLERLISTAGVRPGQTVMIGDRIERDGHAARRVGAIPLIKSNRPLRDWTTFRNFDDAIFAELFVAASDTAEVAPYASSGSSASIRPIE